MSLREVGIAAKVGGMLECAVIQGKMEGTVEARDLEAGEKAGREGAGSTACSQASSRLDFKTAEFFLWEGWRGMGRGQSSFQFRGGDSCGEDKEKRHSR